jgi:hypothetical protein
MKNCWSCVEAIFGSEPSSDPSPLINQHMAYATDE